MTDITHHEARALLQVAADQSLTTADRSALDAHLVACPACRSYADRLAGLEGSLRSVLHARWDPYRPHLNLQAIQHPSPAKLIWNNFFSQTNALGKATIMAALLLGYFVIINLVGVRVPITENETPTALPTPNGSTSTFATSPTLTAQSTYTDSVTQACNTVMYIVREDDTLESIAIQHGITKETVLEYNKNIPGLATNTVMTGMELVIPLCEGAPSFTASLPGNMLTITPMNGTVLPEQPQ